MSVVVFNTNQGHFINNAQVQMVYVGLAMISRELQKTKPTEDV